MDVSSHCFILSRGGTTFCRIWARTSGEWRGEDDDAAVVRELETIAKKKAIYSE